MIDVLIVGGGPSGLSTALFLVGERPSLEGRVVVLEKERYPRDKPCAGGVGARADAALATIGVRVDVPSAPVRGAALLLPSGGAASRPGLIGRVVRRADFDHALARAAEQRGVRILEGTKASRLERDADGVTVWTSAGPKRARVVVGADGVGSVVRREIGLGFGRLYGRAIEIDTATAPGDRDDLIAFDLSDRTLAGYAWDFPAVPRGEFAMSRGVYQLATTIRAPDVGALLAARLAARGIPFDRTRARRFSERGFDPFTPFAIPRVLLVGEACGIDPITGEGIAQSIEQGAFAGSYLADKLARCDLSFADHRRRFFATRAGIDLALRSVIAPRFYGPERPLFERLIASSPEIAELFADRFAGRRLARTRLVKAALLTAMTWLRAGRAGAG